MNKFKVGDVVKRVRHVYIWENSGLKIEGEINFVSSTGYALSFVGGSHFFRSRDYELVEKEEPKEYIVAGKQGGGKPLGDYTKMTLKEAEESARHDASRGFRIIYRVQPIASFTPNTEIVRKDLT